MKKLEELCEDIVLDGVCRGIYQNLALDVTMSNVLFKKFLARRDVSTAAVVNGFREWHVTKFEKFECLTMEGCDFIRKCDNVEILEFETIELFKDPRLGRRDVDIVPILQGLLNESSQKSLKKLTILGGRMKYKIDWNKFKFLPNLEYLNLPKIQLNCFTFFMNIGFFENLRELDISYSGLLCFTSAIRKLVNLEVLNIEGVEITDEKRIEEVFELKKLKVLIMGDKNNNKNRTPHFYVQCKKGLPELRFLDFSYSDVTTQMVKSILSTHPKLELLNLIGTQIDTNFVPETSQPRILVIKTIQNCVDTFQFLTKKGCPQKTMEKCLDRVLSRIQDLLRNRPYPVVSAHTLALEIVSLLERNISGADLIGRIVNCLRQLLERNRHLIFTQPELDSIVRSLLSVHRKSVDIPFNNLFETIWYTLSNGILLDRLSVETIDEICITGIADIRKFRLPSRCILSYCIPKATHECRLQLSRNVNLKFFLITSFNTHTSFIRVLTLLSTYVPEDNLKVSKWHIKLFMQAIKDECEPTLSVLINNLELLVTKMDKSVLGNFFNKTNLEIFRYLMSLQHPDVQESVIHLLVTIIESSGELADHNFEDNLEVKNRQIMELVEKYEAEHGSYSTGFSIFKYIRRAKKEEHSYPRLWAETILKYQEQQMKEAPPKKKRRVK